MSQFRRFYLRVLFACQLLFFTSVLIFLPLVRNCVFPSPLTLQLKMSSIPVYLCHHSTFPLSSYSSILIIVFFYHKALAAKGRSILITSVWLPRCDSKLCWTCPRSNSWFVCEFRLLIPGPVSDLFMWVACVLKGWALHFSSQVTCGPLESQKFSTW